MIRSNTGCLKAFVYCLRYGATGIDVVFLYTQASKVVRKS